MYPDERYQAIPAQLTDQATTRFTTNPGAAIPPPRLLQLSFPEHAKRKLCPLSLLHDRALGIALIGLASLLALLNLSDHALESLADVLIVARAGLGEAAAQLFGKLLAVCECDLALLGAQVGFVADDGEGDCVGALLWEVC